MYWEALLPEPSRNSEECVRASTVVAPVVRGRGRPRKGVAPHVHWRYHCGSCRRFFIIPAIKPDAGPRWRVVLVDSRPATSQEGSSPNPSSSPSATDAGHCLRLLPRLVDRPHRRLEDDRSYLFRGGRFRRLRRRRRDLRHLPRRQGQPHQPYRRPEIRVTNRC